MGAETKNANEPVHGGRDGEMAGRDDAEDRVRSLAPKTQHCRALSVPKVLTPWAVKETRILLLENINPIAVKLFKDHGYTVDEVKHALNEDQLIEHLRSNHYSGLGIRSKTRVTERVIKEAGANVCFYFVFYPPAFINLSINLSKC
jgi:hypothetical protein